MSIGPTRVTIELPDGPHSYWLKALAMGGIEDGSRRPISVALGTADGSLSALALAVYGVAIGMRHAGFSESEISEACREAVDRGTDPVALESYSVVRWTDARGGQR